MHWQITSTVMLCCLLFSSSCSYWQEDSGVKKKTTILAKVYQKKLYLSDLEGMLSGELEKKDSIDLMNSYVDTWIRNNLMLHKAESFLPKDRIDIDKQVEDYKESLVIYTYEKELITQNTDTLVKDAEVKNYYENFKLNFKTKQKLLNGVYAIVNKTAPKVDTIGQWFRIKNKEHKEKLEDYCNQFGEQCQLEPEWFTRQELIELFPFYSDNKLFESLKRGLYQKEEGAFKYYLFLKQIKQKGEIAPLSFVRQDIQKILVNKRKAVYVDQLRKKIYREGMASGEVEIYEK